jgi:hypothetical protein
MEWWPWWHVHGIQVQCHREVTKWQLTQKDAHPPFSHKNVSEPGAIWLLSKQKKKEGLSPTQMLGRKQLSIGNPSHPPPCALCPSGQVHSPPACPASRLPSSQPSTWVTKFTVLSPVKNSLLLPSLPTSSSNSSCHAHVTY